MNSIKELSLYKNVFDDFNFHARVMPILVTILPVLFLVVYNGILSNDWKDNITINIIVIIFLIFTSKIARQLGKRYQYKMYEELGGMPTTILLRYSDNRIDNVTKTRYHRKLNEFVSELNLPLDSEDETEQTDENYKSAINALRVYANSHRLEEPRVYQELKDYNFWRNLYGTKGIAIAIYIVLAIREYFIIDDFNIINLLKNTYPNYIIFIIMIISILIFFFYVTKDNVKQKAFDYAKTLLEVCERL